MPWGERGVSVECPERCPGERWGVSEECPERCPGERGGVSELVKHSSYFTYL